MNISVSFSFSQQMPEEGRLFSTVDRNYKDIMRHLDKDQHVHPSSQFFCARIPLSFCVC